MDVIIELEDWDRAGLETIATAASEAALRHFQLAPDQFEIAVLGCNDARIAELNGDFRDKPTPTNVLSWPSEERANLGSTPDLPDQGELGDIAIAFESCEREASEQGKSFDDHVTHLIVHATLHLLGYDHENDHDATLMERLEVEILATMGIADPY